MFQHFRLSESTIQQPLSPPQSVNNVSQYANNPPTTATFSSAIVRGPGQTTTTKAPYGSGDSEDGYTLLFPNLAAFNEWRMKEEEANMVEFVKGDTHGSKAVPPRFKEHTKLLCARHSRSGRKKYVKKHPERVRKVPSRKLEGQGCPASIKYKTYFDSDEVRACYNSVHSHEIGVANLPYTRRGRKAAAEKREPWNKHDGNNASAASTSNNASSASAQPVAGPSSEGQNQNAYSNAVSMIAPLPSQSYPGNYGYSAPTPFQAPSQATQMAQERWDNMAVLFNNVRENARTIEYPGASIAALESCLIRLFLESPPAAPAASVALPGSVPHANGNAHNRASAHPAVQADGNSTDGSGEEDMQ